jgi:hypothetical protein
MGYTRIIREGAAGGAIRCQVARQAWPREKRRTIPMTDLNKFREWQREKPRRHVNIKIGDPSNPDEIEIWCYDYNLQVGQHVQDVSEIDLEAEYMKDMERTKRKVDKYFQQREMIPQ